MNNRNSVLRRTRRSRHAFTLVEVLVALGILAILLVIIVLPLRLGFDSFNAGNAQSLTQSALQATMTDMEKDIRQAIYVFPNARVLNVTDQAPYNKTAPYFRSIQSGDTGDPTAASTAKACGTTSATQTSQHWSDPARLDMVQVRRDAQGDVLTPLKPSYTIVSYYARRQQLDKAYDPIDNPVVMYRAEYPAFAVRSDGTPVPLKVTDVTDAFNAKIDFTRNVDAATCSSVGAEANRSALWLTNNVFGEANLLPLTNPNVNTATFPDVAANAAYSHTLAIPRGLALQASRAFRATIPVPTDFDPANEAPLVPDSSFVCTDTNNDGKIDRVTISLALASFDVGAQGQLDQNFQPKGTVLRGTRTIDLPNIQ